MLLDVAIELGKLRVFGFFDFHSDSERCAKWVAAVRRSGWKPNLYTRICSDHFVNGELCMRMNNESRD